MMEVRYDPGSRTALIDNPERGFAQFVLSEMEARALALIIEAEFVMCRPGTTVPA